MILKPNTPYIIITFLIFTTEILIATYLKTGFIRHTFGDFMVVILIYTFIKSFLDIEPFKLAVAVLVFAYSIEFLQMVNLLKILNLQDSKAANLILGSTFQITDLVAYTLGALTVLIIELKLQKS
ncbi:ribosomal maturation YjgA family protein [Flavisericum labens]|uniref:ribosomal maturation YjgA family protein n=1 Tax=Flavisericum labens TaxID=3377112 RepID=UPI00387AC8CE